MRSRSSPAGVAALSDPRVADWIVQRVTKERLDGASIKFVFVDRAWQLTIRVEPGRSTVRPVDPVTGHVDDVQLAD